MPLDALPTPTVAPLPPNWGRMNEVARTEWLDANRPDAIRESVKAALTNASGEWISEVVARRDVRAFNEALQRALDMRDDAERDGTSQAEQDRIEQLKDAVSELAALAWSRAHNLPAHLQRAREAQEREAEEARAKDAEWVKGEAKRLADRRAGFKAGSNPKTEIPPMREAGVHAVSHAWLQGFSFARSIA